MYTKDDLLAVETMPEWKDISLALYKEFTETILFPKLFRYYLENGCIIDVRFKEWAMKHLWAIHHIDFRVDKDELFSQIDKGYSFENLGKVLFCTLNDASFFALNGAVIA